MRFCEYPFFGHLKDKLIILGHFCLKNPKNDEKKDILIYMNVLKVLLGHSYILNYPINSQKYDILTKNVLKLSKYPFFSHL